MPPQVAPAFFAKMSNKERIQTSLRWIRDWVRLIARLPFKGRSRFYVLTPPFVARQIVYDSLTRKFLKLRIRDNVDWTVAGQIFSGNDYGVEMLSRHEDLAECYRQLVKTNRAPLILDCGANSGMATRFFKETYPDSRIVAVEPDEENLELAKANNSGDDIQFLLAGIGNTDTRGNLVDAQQGNWAYRMADDPAGSVEIISVNTVLARHDASAAPFIVKIDIEGFESNLFLKNTEWIDRFPLLIIELHDWMLPKTANSRNFLKEISKLDRDFVFKGENVFSISNAISASRS